MGHPALGYLDEEGRFVSSCLEPRLSKRIYTDGEFALCWKLRYCEMRLIREKADFGMRDFLSR
jgi:hypothetical protein